MPHAQSPIKEPSFPVALLDDLTLCRAIFLSWDGYRVQGVTREVKNSHSKEYMQQRMLKNCLKNDKKMKKLLYQRRRNRKAVSPSQPEGRLICFSTRKFEEKIDN